MLTHEFENTTKPLNSNSSYLQPTTPLTSILPALGQQYTGVSVLCGRKIKNGNLCCTSWESVAIESSVCCKQSGLVEIYIKNEILLRSPIWRKPLKSFTGLYFHTFFPSKFIIAYSSFIYLIIN